MDFVTIDGLKVLANVGVHAWEKDIQSTLFISFSTEIQGPHIAKTDDISNAIDYEQVAEEIQNFCQSQRYALIETLGHKLLQHLKEIFGLKSTKLSIEKPGAIRSARHVSVSLEA